MNVLCKYVGVHTCAITFFVHDFYSVMASYVRSYKCSFIICEEICLFCLGSESTPTLVFGYYYDVLLMYINADQIVTKMISAELLSLHDQDVIFTGHSVYQRNKLLLHYVKFMDVISILVFCKLNQSIWPWIGSQFVAGMYVHMYMYACTILSCICIVIYSCAV